MRPSRSNHRDTNEASIVKTLRSAGATVVHLDKPVDLLIGFRGVNVLIEVKAPAGPRGGTKHNHAEPTAEQSEFIATWRGQVAIVRTDAEALAVIGIVPRGERPAEVRTA